PLAYLGSYALAKRLPGPQIATSIGRERAIEIARAFAKDRGFDVQDWRVTAGNDRDRDAAMALAAVPSRALEAVVAGAGISVEFRSPGRSSWIRAGMSPAGRILSFSSRDPQNSPPAASEAEAEKIGTAFLRDFLGPASPFELGPARKGPVNSK